MFYNVNKNCVLQYKFVNFWINQYNLINTMFLTE